MNNHAPVEQRGTSARQINSGCRRSYDANFKVLVVNEAVRTNNCAAARKYSITENNVRRWRKDYDRLRSANSTRKAFRGPKKGRFSEIDEQVALFVKAKRDEGKPITREIMVMKAIEVATELGVPRTEFKASIGWCRRMMRRFGLTLRRTTSVCQKLPGNFEEKLMSFQRYIIKLRKEHSYLLSQIGNADQTAVYFDMPGSTTVDNVGAKSVRALSTGNEKQRVTVMLTVLADGRKLPPYIILKRKTMPREKPPNVILRVQEKGWMDSALVQDWIKCVWCRRPGALLGQRGMLVLDSFRGHVTAEVKASLQKEKTDLVIIPGGMTSQLQVLDVAVNKPFKDKMRALYNDWLLCDNHPLTPSGKIKKPSVTQLCAWISAAWQSITSESIVNGFKKCCISNDLNGTEDDNLWQDVSEEASGTSDNGSSSEDDDDDAAASE